VLSVRYRGRSIGDVLEMTVSDALAFFADQPRIVRRLTPLSEVGLGYVSLGQPTATLSGGEAQRLKLASFLDIRPAAARGILFLFDEPTTGLHARDVERLLATFRRLISLGHSVVSIEHHLQFLAASDWIIDLGPGGGEQGGQIVAEGTPEELRRQPSSLTGRFLAELASGAGAPARAPSESASRE
jgi:excinuclease ABC subunit A